MEETVGNNEKREAGGKQRKIIQSGELTQKQQTFFVMVSLLLLHSCSLHSK